MKVKFMNFKEMAITQNTGMCSYLTIAWAVPYVRRVMHTRRKVLVPRSQNYFTHSPWTYRIYRNVCVYIV